MMERRHGIFPTECMCFPRSGHHLLVNLLTEYFGGDLRYCEIHHQPESDRIENNPDTNFQKNHDSMLKEPIKSDRRYLVQLREPVRALESRYELDTRTLGVPPKGDWHAVMSERFDYYVGFVKKWLFTPVPLRLVVFYEDLIVYPESVLTTVIQHLTGIQNTDLKRVKTAIESVQPTEQPRYRSAFYIRA